MPRFIFWAKSVPVFAKKCSFPLKTGETRAYLANKICEGFAMSLIIGPHVSIADGIELSIDRAQATGATAFQIFTKSNRSWFASKVQEAEARAFKERFEASTIESVAVHACYLINLASSNADVARKSAKSLAKEMERCADLGIKDLIFHPGAHTGIGDEAGINQIIDALNSVFDQDKTGTNLLLETMAGQGTVIGWKFEQLAQIRDSVKNNKQLFYCFDTCHSFAAGYDLVSKDGFDKTAKELDSTLGFENIRAIQLNDSKHECGARKDRHENLGLGKIGRAGITNVLRHPKLSKLPLLLETPPVNGLETYAEEIKLAKAWASEVKNSA